MKNPEDHRSHHEEESFYRATGTAPLSHESLSSCLCTKHGIARDPNIGRCVQSSKHRVTMAGHPVVGQGIHMLPSSIHDETGFSYPACRRQRGIPALHHHR